MLPFHNHPVLRALAESFMVHEVTILGTGDTVTAEFVPAALQAEDKLTTGYDTLGGAYQWQVMNVFLPPALPDGSTITTENTRKIRVTSSPSPAYVNITMQVHGLALDDSGFYVRLKCGLSGYALGA